MHAFLHYFHYLQVSPLPLSKSTLVIESLGEEISLAGIDLSVGSGWNVIFFHFDDEISVAIVDRLGA